MPLVPGRMGTAHPQPLCIVTGSRPASATTHTHSPPVHALASPDGHTHGVPSGASATGEQVGMSDIAHSPAATHRVAVGSAKVRHSVLTSAQTMPPHAGSFAAAAPHAP